MRFSFVVSVVLLGLFVFGFSNPSFAELSKAQRILIERGLQVQGMVQPDDNFSLTTYSNANYTSLNWLPAYSSGSVSWNSMNRLGTAPGFPWGRWVPNPSYMPPLGNEAPYTNQLVTLSYSDEANLYDPAIFTNMVNWFKSTATNWPNTIRYFNSWGGQINDPTLSSFIAQAQPDLISFDTYPWKSVYDTSQTNSTGPMIGGPNAVLPWYGELRRYRQWSMNYNIPFGIYRQTFTAIEPWSSTVYRHPSRSELRLNTFAALAFNAKMLVDFTYNSGATSLFDRHVNPDGSTVGAGDNYPNALYTEQSDINRRARNLGKALVRLKPVHDLHNANNTNAPGPASGNPNFPDGYTTSIMILKGKYISGGVTNVSGSPNSFLDDPEAPNSYTWWEYQKNDPYLNGWSVTNKGTVNSNLAGEVIISWFTPLDETMDGPTHSNQVYMMVVNALTWTNGTPADCLQEIKLNFANLTGAMTNLIMLDPATGQLQTNGLPLVNTRRQLVLNLNGGDAVLFKFNTGAPFVGFNSPQPARLKATPQPGNPGLGTGAAIQIEGTVGEHYEIQSSSLLPPSWSTLTNLLLPSSPYTFSDRTASPEANRFYRVVVP